MNRFGRWPLEALESDETTLGADSSPEPAADGSLWHHTVFAPCRYEPNYPYPLLIWLHGPGDDEDQLSRIMPHVSLRNLVAVGPRGCSAPLPGQTGYRWEQSEEAILAAEQNVFACLDIACRQFHIAPDRVFIGGYRCGGTMALRIGMRNPGAFAGAISLGAPFPTDHAPLAQLRHLRRLPLLIVQGREIAQGPVYRTCDELRLFHAACLQVALRLYPHDDELTTQMLRDMNDWIMECVTGVKSESSQGIGLYHAKAN
jgi:phospholipase/carboxylesterase